MKNPATPTEKKNSILMDILKSNKLILKLAWKNYRKETIISVLISVVIAFSPYLQRAAEALLINDLTSVAKGVTPLIPIVYFIIIIPAVLLLNVVLFSLFDFYDAKMFRELKLTTELGLAKKLASLDVATHEDPKFRDKIALLNEGGAMWSVPSFYINFMLNLQNIFGLLIVSVIMYNTSWKILVLIILASAPRFIVEVKYGQKVWGLWESNSEGFRRFNHANQQLQEASNIREIQSYQSTNFFLNEIKSILTKFHSAQLGQDKKALLWQILSQLISVSAIGVVIWYLIGAVVVGTIQIGTFVFILASVLGFQATLIGFFLALSRQYKNVKIVLTFNEVMNQTRLIQTNSKSKKVNYGKAPEIIFENVSFSYPASPEKIVLDNFNLKISSGKIGNCWDKRCRQINFY